MDQSSSAENASTADVMPSSSSRSDLTLRDSFRAQGSDSLRRQARQVMSSDWGVSPAECADGFEYGCIGLFRIPGWDIGEEIAEPVQPELFAFGVHSLGDAVGV